METVLSVYAGTEIKEEEQAEFKELLKACGFTEAASFTQLLKAISFQTYIGKGKCMEIQEYLQEHPMNYVLFDQELSPLQIAALEECFQTPVMDRSDLILAIFAKRASSASAKLQIEAAQLKKLLPRLIGAHTSLSRQGGGGLNKGSGEKQLEIDRRRIKSRLHEVEKELKKLKGQRETQRRRRERCALPFAALCGYTNAGKSTIMNLLLSFSQKSDKKKVLQQDMLFATLDTSVRQITLPQGRSFLLSDTVGFVSRLPHELIKAFHSTLEELRYADLLIQVVDASSKQSMQHMEVTMQTLRSIEAADIPMLTVFNKCDKTAYQHPSANQHQLYISAADEQEASFLLQHILALLFPPQYEAELLLPYEQGRLYALLKEEAYIYKEEQKEDGYHLQAHLPQRLLSLYQPYTLSLKKDASIHA